MSPYGVERLKEEERQLLADLSPERIKAMADVVASAGEYLAAEERFLSSLTDDELMRRMISPNMKRAREALKRDLVYLQEGVLDA